MKPSPVMLQLGVSPEAVVVFCLRMQGKHQNNKTEKQNRLESTALALIFCPKSDRTHIYIIIIYINIYTLCTYIKFTYIYAFINILLLCVGSKSERRCLILREESVINQVLLV